MSFGSVAGITFLCIAVIIVFVLFLRSEEYPSSEEVETYSVYFCTDMLCNNVAQIEVEPTVPFCRICGQKMERRKWE